MQMVFKTKSWETIEAAAQAEAVLSAAGADRIAHVSVSPHIFSLMLCPLCSSHLPIPSHFLPLLLSTQLKHLVIILIFVLLVLLSKQVIFLSCWGTVILKPQYLNVTYLAVIFFTFVFVYTLHHVLSVTLNYFSPKYWINICKTEGFTIMYVFYVN